MCNMEEEKVITLFMLFLSFTCFFKTTCSQFQLIVAQDGSGDYTTISQALEAAPNNSPNLINIKIKKGIYKENILVDYYKTNIAFIGDGIENTIITSDRSRGAQQGTKNTATVGVNGVGFVAKDITFENTAGPGAGPAVAFRSSADRTAMYRCAFIGYQDTLMAASDRQFYKDCDIYGTVDFIFGNAAMVLQDCRIYIRQNYGQHTPVITAQGREATSINSAISMQNCNITTEPPSPGLSTVAYLGRPWKKYSRVVIMKSYIGGVVNPLGWLYWDGDLKSLDNVYYGEYSNNGPSSSVDSRVKCLGCKTIVDPNEAQFFTVRSLLDGPSWIPSTGIPFSPDL